MSHTSQARPRVSGEPATWAAKQSAVLEERNRLAGEIHDGLAQSFTAICMANFGLAEARRFAHNLRLGRSKGSEMDSPTY
jgi:signal transduction histidine kinase